MTWLIANLSEVLSLAGLHLYQSVVPLLISVLIAVPLAQLARMNKTLRGVLLFAGSILYTVPSLALFVILPVILGTRILDMANVMVALVIYAVALLLRSTLDALDSVDDGIRQAAVAMGYKPFMRFLTVDLPLSVPVLFAGLRVVSVSNISLVSVGALLGIGSLGSLFTDGLKRDFVTEIVVGIIGTLLLALLMDAFLVLAQRLLTPWLRAAGRPSKGSAQSRAREERAVVGA
ncbi:ABC transporter permease [Arthrobacter sp. H14-L1]|uniref:ABC transporter permease n=1 Tax=Arthrobacter sp. H14-L1 TaxID=2996697 RepID=UPI00226F7EF3|nr:ABC transporter permease [Arthrobacter sp. H14-L1]MCY0903413.1 ABC transporter permease [Arthrobacter sp. H14-L1]